MMIQRAQEDLSHTIWDDPFHTENMAMYDNLFNTHARNEPVCDA
jgi:hypothetical protein